MPVMEKHSFAYDKLHQQILRRDNWRCESCGTMSNLEVHHSEFRSHSSSVDIENSLSAALTSTADVISSHFLLCSVCRKT